MMKNQITADVEVDYETKKVKYTPHATNIYILPFGIQKKPTITDISRFFESRCFPRERRNCRQLLDDLGLDAYVPLDIVRKTHGRQLEDYCWIRFDGETLCYEDVKLRN